jgi:perosamine synthetase
MSCAELGTQILERLRTVLPEERGPLPLHAPTFGGEEWKYVKDCIDTGWVSSVGDYVNRFERMLQEYTGATSAVATMNGTAALHMCLLLAGVKRGEEVLVPTLTFIATANAISYCGAVPHFVDSEEITLGVSAQQLAEYLKTTAKVRDGKCHNRKTGAVIRALVPMHTFGHAVDLDPLMELSEEWKLTVVEDAAESLGSFYKGQHTGNRGKVNALSFNGNKIVTTGGGGAILTNDPELGKRAKHMTTTARLPHKWSFIHDEVGFNYRLPNLNAALGCAQLEQLDRFVEDKRRLAHRYADAFADLADITVFREPGFSRSNYWLNVLVLSQRAAASRDCVLQVTNDAGLMTRPLWQLMHRLDMYRDCPRMELPVAESLERRIINIPSSAVLSRDYGQD